MDLLEFLVPSCILTGKKIGLSGNPEMLIATQLVVVRLKDLGCSQSLRAECARDGGSCRGEHGSLFSTWFWVFSACVLRCHITAVGLSQASL